MGKSESIPLREYIQEQFNTFNKKLDYILNPKTGVFRELNIINQKAEAAHNRIDLFEKKKKQKKEIQHKIILITMSALMGVVLKILYNVFWGS